MKSTYRFGAAGVAMFAALGLASAAHAAPATATATANAEIVAALQITKVSDLDFGKVAITGGVGGDVVVDTAGAVTTCNGGLTCYSTTSAAAFDVVGTPSKTLTVQFPASATLTTGAGATAAEQLDLSALTTDAAPLSDGVGGFVADYYTIDTDATTGEASFAVGGTLTFDGSEVQGLYAADLVFLVDYQ